MSCETRLIELNRITPSGIQKIITVQIGNFTFLSIEEAYQFLENGGNSLYKPPNWEKIELLIQPISE